MLAAYYEGKQIALHRISYQRKDMVIDFPLKPSDLSRYDEVLYD